MSETLIPELRFAGFDEEWLPHPLAKVASVSKGQGYSKSDLRERGVPVFLYGRLYTQLKLAVTEVGTFTSARPNSVFSKGGEVLIPASGETPEDIVRASALLKPGVILGGDLNVLRPFAGFDSVLLALRICTGDPRTALVRRAQGKSVVHLRGTDLNSISLTIPKQDEQQEIGSLFTRLESLINQHRRKHTQLKQTKVALMQRLFPREGADEPELRFDGFSGAWEQRSLSSLGKARAGFGFPEVEQDGRSGIPFYKVSDMNLPGNKKNMTLANHYVTLDQVQRKQWTPVTEVPAIIFAKVGAAVFLGRKRMALEPFLMDNNMMSYSLDVSQWDTEFARSVFERLDLSRLVQTGALPSFNPPAVEALEVWVAPTRAEQQAIGAFFTKLDELIAAEQSYIEKLRQVKSGLLQKMFV